MDDQEDVFARQQSLARRQKLLDAMQQSNLGSPIQGQYGLAQALAKIGTAYFLNKSGKDVDAAQAQTSKDYSTALDGELNDYLQRRSGTPGQTLSDDQASALMNDNVDPGALREPVKADPRGAVVRAMTSRFPEMQKLGGAEFQGLVKQEAPLTPKDLLTLNGFDPKSRLTAAMGGGLQALQPESEFMNVDGRVVDKRDPTKVAADYRERYGETFVIDGDRYQMDSRGQLKKLDNAPKVTVNSSTRVINAGQKAGMEQWAKGAADTVKALGEQARAAEGALTSLSQLEALSNSGTFTGPTSGPAMWLGQLANAAGMRVDPNKLSNSEAFNSVAADAAQKIIGQYGGNRGVTKEEAEQIRMIVPQLTHSPQARMQLTGILRGMANRSIENFQKANSAFNSAIKAEDPELFNFGGVMLPNTQGVPPQPGAAPAGGAPVVKNW